MDQTDRKTNNLKTESEAQADLDFDREKDLQIGMCNLLNLRGIWYQRQRMDRKSTGTSGCPDFLFSINGKAIAVEAKVGKNDLSPDQEDAIHHMKKNGWKVYVVKSIEEFKKVLDEESTCPTVRECTCWNLSD